MTKRKRDSNLIPSPLPETTAVTLGKDITAIDAHISVNPPPFPESLADTTPLSTAGLPEWLCAPKHVPAQLTHAEYNLSIEDPQLALSARIRNQCIKHRIHHLFPVQVAVLQALLGQHTDCSKPWRNRFLNTLGHPGDVLVSAPTGSGKTLGYVLPLVEMLSYRAVPCLRALVVVPTRDLVRQVTATFQHYVQGTDIKVLGISGGQPSAGGQEDTALAKERLVLGAEGGPHVDVLVTTPGRLVDHFKGTPGFTLGHLRWLVMDEADRLLNQSFHAWLEKALDACGGSGATSLQEDGLFSLRDSMDNAVDLSGVFSLGRISTNGSATHVQKLLFSATLTRNPGKIAALRLTRPRYLAAASQPCVDGEADQDPADHTDRYILPDALRQVFTVVPDLSQKPLYLLLLIYRHQLTSALCFTNSVDNAERLCTLLQRFTRRYPVRSGKYTVAAYTSSLSPAARTATIQKFQRGEIDVLVCTDALARGVDISAGAIVNYDVPPAVKTFVHRVGRTARAGREGIAYSLLCQHECRYWKSMMRKYGLYDRQTKWTDSEVYGGTYGLEAMSFEQMKAEYEAVMRE